MQGIAKHLVLDGKVNLYTAAEAKPLCSAIIDLSLNARSFGLINVAVANYGIVSYDLRWP